MNATQTYPATATHDGRWWVVEVDGIGAAQGRTTVEAQRMAVGMVAAMEDLDEDDIDVLVTFVPHP